MNNNYKQSTSQKTVKHLVLLLTCSSNFLLISHFSKKCQIKDIWLFVDYFYRTLQKTDYIIISGKTVISSLGLANLLKLAFRNTPLSPHQPTHKPKFPFERTLLQVTLKDNVTQKWKFSHYLPVKRVESCKTWLSNKPWHGFFSFTLKNQIPIYFSC